MWEFLTEIDRSTVAWWAGTVLVVPVSVCGMAFALDTAAAPWAFRRLARLGRRVCLTPDGTLALLALPLLAVCASLRAGVLLDPLALGSAAVAVLLAAQAAAQLQLARELQSDREAVGTKPRLPAVPVTEAAS